MLGYAAQALHVSAQAFYDTYTSLDDKRLILEYAAMPEREKSILRYVASGWDGDAHALIHWIAMYMSVDKCARSDLAGYAIHRYHELLDDGRINRDAPMPDMEYIERACDALRKK